MLESISLAVIALFLSVIRVYMSLKQDKFEYLATARTTGMLTWLRKLQMKGEGMYISAATYSNIDHCVQDAFLHDFNMIIEEFPFYKMLDKKMQTGLVQLIFKDFVEKFRHFLGPCEDGFTNEFIIQMYSRFYVPNQEVVSCG